MTRLIIVFQMHTNENIQNNINMQEKSGILRLNLAELFGLKKLNTNILVFNFFIYELCKYVIDLGDTFYIIFILQSYIYSNFICNDFEKSRLNLFNIQVLSSTTVHIYFPESYVR